MATSKTQATTFTWAIPQLDRKTADGFVFCAHYNLTADDGTYIAATCGTVSFERPSSLIPYDQLTEDVVIGWVKDALGGPSVVAEIENQLQSQINEKANPTDATGVPWS